jgi:hypothetical protein
MDKHDRTMYALVSNEVVSIKNGRSPQCYGGTEDEPIAL